MQRYPNILSLVTLLLAAALTLAACDAAGPGNVQNLPPPQDQGELEENIEESGLEGQTGVAGQAAQEGDTVQEQIESNIEAYELGSRQGLVAASWLIGRNVEDMNENDLGDISDLLVERGTGRVLYALVEHGGLLDMAEAVLPVPLGIFQLREQDELILPVQDSEMWGAFPDLGDTWTTALTSDQAAQIGAFWNEAGLPVEDVGDLANARWLPLSSVQQSSVNAGETAIGQVRDVLIDLSSGHVKYVAIATSGDETRPALLPYAAFDPAGEGETLSLVSGFDPALLAESPDVETDSLAQTGFVDPAWDDAQEGYWSEHGFDGQ